MYYIVSICFALDTEDAGTFILTYFMSKNMTDETSPFLTLNESS